MSSQFEKMRSSWPLAVKRGLHSWRLLSSVALGVLLASAIMAGNVIYFDALKDMALRDALGKLSTTETDVLLQGQRGPTTRAEYDKVATIATAQFDANLAWILRDTYRAARSPTFFLSRPGEEHLAGDGNARSYFAFVSQLDQHITVQIPGSLPRDGPLSGPGEPLVIEAMIPHEASEIFGVGVGDSLVAVPPWVDATPLVTVVISGVFTRNDAGHEFWYQERDVLNAVTGASFRTAPFFISEAAYLDVLGPAFSEMDSTYSWLLAVDPERIDAAGADAVLAGVEGLSRSLGETLSAYRQSTRLDGALAEYDRRLFFARLPMSVVLILIAVVVLYYIATISSLAVEGRRAEVALLRSRGAGSTQVLVVFVIEGAAMSLIAVLAGPPLAGAGISLLGYAPGLSSLTGGALLDVTISRGAYLMSALGGILSIAALTVPAVRASRMSVTGHRQQLARPATQPIFQRYYMDVLLLLLGIYLLRQLNEQRSVVADRLFGEPAVDWIMLALPAIVLLASAMVLVRLFPPVMAAGSRLLSTLLPPGPVLGLWQMARNPTHYARLSLLLILTAGLGIFASSFGATLERSFEERVLYATGSDIRVEDVRERVDFRARFRRFGRATSSAPRLLQEPRATMAEVYGDVPGVVAVGPVMRNTAHDLSDSEGRSYTILAIDDESFSEVAWVRDDFSDKPIEALLTSLKPSGPAQGIVLPEDAVKLRVTLRAGPSQAAARLTARIRNAQDRYATFSLGSLTSREWTTLEADLVAEDPHLNGIGLPLTLVALRVDGFGGGGELRAGSIVIDSISVVAVSGETRIVEPFDDVSSWAVLGAGAESADDLLRESRRAIDGDSGYAIFTWSRGSVLTARGIYHGVDGDRLPVIASRSLISDTGHARGAEFDVSVGGFRLPVRVIDTVDYFPTMTVPGQNFLLADLTGIVRYSNLGATFRQLEANELWISTVADGPARRDLLNRLDNVPGYTSTSIHDRRALLAQSRADPLVMAGWRSLLFVAFSAVLVLSCLGFLVHAYVSFQDRRLQFALLRTVGFSWGQLAGMLWFEQTLVIAAGMALGAWMGGRLGAIIMPFLGRDDFGAEVLPPFAMEVNWGALLIVYALLLAAFAAITMAVVWVLRREALQQIFRMGGET